MIRTLHVILFICGLTLWLLPPAAAAQQYVKQFDGAPVAPEPGPRVLFFSSQFLGRPYVAGTLGGGEGLPEKITINLEEVDCFTLLDYVEAMRRSRSGSDFRKRLIQVRYRNETVSWQSRRHFFSDWRELPGIVDVTAKVGGDMIRNSTKVLNHKGGGQFWLPGVPVREVSINWIPAEALTAKMRGRLQDGDYVGIYSPAPGLDVSHVGIVLRKKGELFLRHASVGRGVVDSRLSDYLKTKSGIIVLRPLPL